MKIADFRGSLNLCDCSKISSLKFFSTAKKMVAFPQK
uniref:Uncharacterized protein n=1 Tax=Arundo donax TaxID=35708 RepID=A0A0A8YAV6_ARUDO